MAGDGQSADNVWAMRRFALAVNSLRISARLQQRRLAPPPGAFLMTREEIELEPEAGAPLRKIVHVDMDAFYASVEQRDDPSLRGKPVIVAWRGNRSVVCAASYEARRFGVRSAMPAIRAERLCPGAIFIPPDFTRYKAASRAAREIFSRHTELIEPLSLDEAYLDVTENKLGLPTATRVAKMIRRQIREELNLTASAGVAPNKFLAKIASDWRKPDGLFVIQPAEALAFLLPLPVGRIPGVGRVTENRLKEAGVVTVGDLRDLGLEALEIEFGRYGRRLFELANGIDHNPVTPNRPTKSISAEDTFESDMPLSETEELIRRLAEKVWAASRKETRIARTVTLKLKTSDFNIMTRSHTPPSPPASCEEFTAIALSLRERVAVTPDQRFRLVGVGLSNFIIPEQSQPTLFEGFSG
jgi:DNA polymerase-4